MIFFGKRKDVAFLKLKLRYKYSITNFVSMSAGDQCLLQLYFIASVLRASQGDKRFIALRVMYVSKIFKK